MSDTQRPHPLSHVPPHVPSALIARARAIILEHAGWGVLGHDPVHELECRGFSAEEADMIGAILDDYAGRVAATLREG